MKTFTLRAIQVDEERTYGRAVTQLHTKTCMYVSTNTLCWFLRFPEMHYFSKYKKRTARGERDRQITKYTPN